MRTAVDRRAAVMGRDNRHSNDCMCNREFRREDRTHRGRKPIDRERTIESWLPNHAMAAVDGTSRRPPRTLDVQGQHPARYGRRQSQDGDGRLRPYLIALGHRGSQLQAEFRRDPPTQRNDHADTRRRHTGNRPRESWRRPEWNRRPGCQSNAASGDNGTSTCLAHSPRDRSPPDPTIPLCPDQSGASVPVELN